MDGSNLINACSLKLFNLHVSYLNKYGISSFDRNTWGIMKDEDLKELWCDFVIESDYNFLNW